MTTFYSIFLNESLIKEQKSYPDVGLSKQNIFDAQSQQKCFCWFVQTYLSWL